MREYTTRVVTYTKPPMSLNDRTHWRVKAKHTKAIREYVREWAFYRVPRMDNCHVELHYVPRDRRRRDTDNLFPTLKPAIDGIKDAGVVADDDSEHVSSSCHIDAPNSADPHLYIVVSEGRRG